MAQNTRRGGFLVRHFVHNYKHNSKTKGGIRAFYLSNNCSTMLDIHSLGWSYMLDAIGELGIQTRNTTTFRYTILCVLTFVTRELQVAC